MVKSIPLTQGKFAIVNDEDFEKVSQFKWYAHCKKKENTWYARRKISGGKSLSLHRYLLGLSNPKILTDHINGDGLDNTRKNIRPCSSSENRANSKKTREMKYSRFKGVTISTKSGRWQAQIRKNKREYYLGLFDSEIDAAKAYDCVAIKYFGNFAKLNFPEAQK